MRYSFFLAIVCLFIATACTKDIVIDDIPAPEDSIVVEGNIEIGQPPFVTLTKNSAFFGGIDINDFSAFFVRGARVEVSTTTDTVLLMEICTDELPDETQRLVAEALGFGFSDTIDIPNICIYTVPDIVNYFLTGTSMFMGEANKSYGLSIESEGFSLTSKTYIPGAVPIALTSRPHPNDGAADSLVTVVGTFTEPDTVGNYLRYWTQRNEEELYPPASGSVFDDLLFSAQTFSLPIERGQDPQEDFEFETYGYFWKGDTVLVKWASIDRGCYEFWQTLENDGGDSPFSSPVRIKTNIKGDGGLGVWCGYGTYFADIIVPQ